MLLEMHQKLRMEILHNDLSRAGAGHNVYIYTHLQELMKSVGSHSRVTAICDEGGSLTLCEQLS